MTAWVVSPFGPLGIARSAFSACRRLGLVVVLLPLVPVVVVVFSVLASTAANEVFARLLGGDGAEARLGGDQLGLLGLLNAHARRLL